MNSDRIITIRNLYKTYGKGESANEVLKGINLDISKGQIIGYIGPNGAGKSTTVKILCGMISDFKGDIEVLGHKLKKDDMEIKKHIGYVPENGALYEMLTPKEYLSLIGTLYSMKPEVTEDRIQHFLKYFGLEKNIDQRMDTFSKGMKQKILITAGVLNNPDILFLDEPLNGLDANSVIQVKELLTSMAEQGKTIFYSSHLMDVVEKISNRIILINNGNVVADGTFEELKADEAISLEQLFAKLTGNGMSTTDTAELLNSLKGE
ncbi:ABC transporter ATP-binding protein [Saccharicrinis sp. FJH54]|uniref:ABC transporter ATP-binding protein n=1 Tax=Saccharicrinis sp. FJH54 TaxID=3344665 RepID=UPI0035D428AC